MSRYDRRGIAAVAMALAVAGCDKGAGGDTSTGVGATKPLTTIAPPAGRDWTETVTMSPAGGFVMGNPQAPVKLVEYASLTCPHCAEFAEKGVPALRDTYVKSGQVSWEYRNFLLNAIDAPVSILARCQGPTPFFKLVEQLYAEQPKWVANFQNISPEDQKRLGAMQPQQQMSEVVKLGKLDAFFRQRGVPEGKIAACLADPKQTDALAKLRDAGAKDNITGTPSFLINGKLQDDVYGWEPLEPKIKAAIAG